MCSAFSELGAPVCVHGGRRIWIPRVLSGLGSGGSSVRRPGDSPMVVAQIQLTG